MFCEECGIEVDEDGVSIFACDPSYHEVECYECYHNSCDGAC